MSNDTPYWVKWIGGIAATIIATYVTFNYINNKKQLDDVDLLEYHADGAAFKFKYPPFLKHVRPDPGDVYIRVVAGNPDPSFFDELFSRVGWIAIGLWPNDIYDFLVESDDDSSNQSDSQPINPFDPNPPIFSREISISDNQPNTYYLANPIEFLDVVRVEYNFIGEAITLQAIGIFSDSVWEENKTSIEKSLKGIEVDENAARRWLEGDQWFGIATRKDSDGNQITDADDRLLPYCVPSVWSPSRLEELGCELTKEYEKLKVIKFECPNDRVVALIQSRADCNQLRGANYTTDNDTPAPNSNAQ